MRFAPPKSAPPDRRSLAKDNSEAHYGRPILSGWLSPQDLRGEETTLLQDEEDVTLLKECAAASKRRCSSAAIQRLKFSHSAFVQLEKLGRLGVSKSETNLTSTISTSHKENGSCTVSKDSGVSELVSSSSMDRFGDEEFSDLSDSDDSSIKEELQISWSSKTSLLEDTAAVEEARSEIKQYLEKLNKFKDLSVRDTEKTEYNGEFKKGIVRSHTIERSPTKRRQQRSQTPDDRQSTSFQREPTIPHSFTTDLPERPSQTQLWSKRQKERLQNIKNQGATSPLHNNQQPQSIPVNNKVNKQSPHFPGSLLQLNDTAQSNGVKINLESVMGSLYSRPPYRNDKRRGSSISKSSASIPSLSTPCQALLLVGVQPTKPLGNSKNTKKSNRNSGAFKPSLPSSQYAKYVQEEQNVSNLVELPALMVNGAGDLVIKKKQIMPT